MKPYDYQKDLRGTKMSDLDMVMVVITMVIIIGISRFLYIMLEDVKNLYVSTVRTHAKLSSLLLLMEDVFGSLEERQEMKKEDKDGDTSNRS